MRLFKRTAACLVSSLMLFLPARICAYERVPVTLTFKEGGELHTSFYCFNDVSEGRHIAEEIFHLKKYTELARGTRKKMIPVPLGTRVGYYDWAIFGYGYEVWLFEVRNGYLWGRGTLLDAPLAQ